MTPEDAAVALDVLLERHSPPKPSLPDPPPWGFIGIDRGVDPTRRAGVRPIPIWDVFRNLSPTT